MKRLIAAITESYIAVAAFVLALLIIEISVIGTPASHRFIPRWHCWQEDYRIAILEISSDAIIALSYFLIPVFLAILARKEKGKVTLFHYCFAGFILLCGVTHIMSIVVIWHPLYWVDGGVKAATAIFSTATLILFGRYVYATPTADEAEAIAESHEEMRLWIVRLKEEIPEARVWIEKQENEKTPTTAQSLLKNYANLRSTMSGQGNIIKGR